MNAPTAPGDARELPSGGSIGLIAGSGVLPLLVAQGIRAAGHRVACIGLHDHFHADLPSHCDTFERAGVLQIGRWIRLMRASGVADAVLVGRVKKATMYRPLQLLRQMPDLRTVLLYYQKLRFDRRSPALLAAVAEELAASGVHLMDSTRFIADHIATEGIMGRTAPSAAQQRDIDFGWPILRSVANLGIGQAITVRDCDVIAVEAMEGTDATIDRTAAICRRVGWTMLKTTHDSHDLRADVPTVGVQTVERIAAAGGRVLALGAGRVIMLERDRVIATADRLGVALVGIRGAAHDVKPL